MSIDRDMAIRLAAMARLAVIRDRGDGLVRARDLEDGFIFENERIPLWNARRGIWRPAQLSKPGAALTIVTAPRYSGRAPAYDDEVADEERRFFGYRYEGTKPDHWTNRAVRVAFELRRPLIYLYGVTKGTYEPIFPVYVVGDDPDTLTFAIQADVPFSAKEPEAIDLLATAPRREYQTVAVKRRVHQHRFRQLVLGAYRRRCAICRLHHETLLDAAHIIPDHDDRGLPEIPNGISLCKIHHSAFDANILGIAPDLRVHIRDEILAEIDGPMLEHGLKAMHGQVITVPRAEVNRPREDFLEERYSRFLAA